MRVSREDAQENRQRVVETASRLFREHGYDGIGIAGLMKASGLTNGAFYKQFASKDALIAEATAHALSENLDRWRNSIQSTPNSAPGESVAKWYLTKTHEEKRATGCTFAALGGDAPRQGKEVRQAFDKGLRETLTLLDEEAGGKESASSKAALRQLSLMVGALVLSRAAEDPDLKTAFLEAAAEE
ncbi:TetR/AcrR family transcriptional regulator [Labrenzia sp. PHM005]|nr:TetR/AcrR family transcriptional regulator [Labrenzia sp. PHM005]QDG77575.1 TetR/AcrR family transcriptional regulator [Labrenzia sp. PHM005]